MNTFEQKVELSMDNVCSFEEITQLVVLVPKDNNTEREDTFNINEALS
jgi:hypothetical protein